MAKRLLIGVLFISLAVAAWFVWLAIRGVEIPSSQTTATFRVGLSGLGEINTLDPARVVTSAPLIVVWQVFDRLVNYDQNGNPAAMLAEKWSHNSDLTEWRFTLRKDAFFQNENCGHGKPVAASDVKASLERAISFPGYPQILLRSLIKGADAFIEGKAASIEGIVDDEGEIVFRLNKPFRFLPERLAGSFYGIVPQGIPKNGTEIPRGSGPYCIRKWDQETNRVTLERFVGYWGTVSTEAPENLEIVAFQNEAVASEEFRNANLDWLEATISSLSSLREIEKAQSGIRVTLPETTTVRFVALNLQKEPFKSHPDLAIALNLAINRAALVTLIGGGRPVSGPIPGGNGFPFGPDRAAKIVASLPKKAKRFDILVEPNAEARLLSEAVQLQWKKIGAEVAIRPGLSDFVDKVIHGDYTAASIYFGPFAATAEQYLWMYDGKSQPVPNFMHFESSEFDDNYAAFLRTPNQALANAALDKAVAAVLDRPPVVWMVQVPLTVGIRGGFTVQRPGFSPTFHTLQHE